MQQSDPLEASTTAGGRTSLEGKPARRSACSSCAGTYGAPLSPRATACSGPRCTTQRARQACWLHALPGATGGTSTRLRACRSKNKINYIR